MIRPVLILLAAMPALAFAEPPPAQWVQATAYAVPKETTSEGSGYFAIVPGHNGKLYIGTAKYRFNSYLVEFDTKTKQMKIVVDSHKEIGQTTTGFAAQSKIHTRCNVGGSGKVYLGTKQGYPDKTKGEKATDYLGGHPMVYDPATGKTKVYPIPIPHHGIISITPDESRDIAYISTCSDAGTWWDPNVTKERPTESSHFMILDLKTGKYRDLMDCHHLFAFIVIDYKGRAYHPIKGGDIARFDPVADKLEQLKQTIDGRPPSKESNLALPETHAINWEISPDRKTLYCLAMSTNQLYAYDLTAEGDTLPGRSLGTLIPGAKETDCRAMCVSPTGQVWASVTVGEPDGSRLHHLVSYQPGDKSPIDHGPVAIKNPDYTPFTDSAGKPLPFHYGIHKTKEGVTTTKYVTLGVAATKDAVYAMALVPYTLLEVPLPVK